MYSAIIQAYNFQAKSKSPSWCQETRKHTGWSILGSFLALLDYVWLCQQRQAPGLLVLYLQRFLGYKPISKLLYFGMKPGHWEKFKTLQIHSLSATKGSKLRLLSPTGSGYKDSIITLIRLISYAIINKVNKFLMHVRMAGSLLSCKVWNCYCQRFLR